MEPEIIPAILAKDREELLRRISLVKGHVKTIQLDIMDGDFVPNKTVGLEQLHNLPAARYEYHWMVKDPIEWIGKTHGPHMHLVHIETISSFEEIENAVKAAGGELGLALNPETPLGKILPYAEKVKEILIMTVHPGFSGQKYIPQMEEKMKELRRLHPRLDIEVDGGINRETIGRAYAAGANLLAAASSIFSTNDVKSAIEDLRRCAISGCQA